MAIINSNDYLASTNLPILKVPKLLYTEKEKQADDKAVLKKLVRYYEHVATRQVSAQEQYYNKLHNIADGVIDINDYVDSEEIEQLQHLDPSIKFDEETIDLENFPIIPPIINRLTGDISKKQTDFFIQAENVEATNQIIEKRNDEIKQILLEHAKQLFDQENPLDPKATEEQQKQRKQMFEQIPAVQRAYKTNFRLEIEEWADHVMRWENRKFNMKDIERRAFRERLVTNKSLVHVRLVNDHYYPELINPRYYASLRSPKTVDESDSMMCCWFDFSNIGTILNKYAGVLKEEDVEQLEKWQAKLHSNFVLPDQHGGINPYIESMQNYVAATNVISNSVENGTNYDGFTRLIRETNMYFLLPRKVGVLYAIVNGELTVTEVDETFEVTRKPIYQYKGSKDTDDLIDGEHVEWTYINELWYCLKLDMRWTSPLFKIDEAIDKDNKPIYVFLDRFPIQYKDKSRRYGIKIPVHGGSDSRPSHVEKGAPFAKFYNYIWNRNKQILSTEIGKFLIMSQNMIPNESMGEDWGKGNLIKAYSIAKDMSLMPADTSLTNMGVNQMVSGNYGQVVDLSKTQDVLEKVNLAKMIKQECFETLGISYQLLGETSPYMSPTLAASNMQQTITQLQHLYDGHFEQTKLVRETMLETAQYLTSIGEMTEVINVSSDGVREIFRLSEPETMLYDLVLYPTNNIEQYINFETLKQMAIADNNLTSTAYEKALMVLSETPSELVRRLKEEQDKLEKQQQQERDFQMQQQQQMIDAQNEQIQRKIDYETNRDNLDRQERLLEAQIEAVGRGNSDSAQIREELLKLQSEGLRQKEYYTEMDAMLQKNMYDQERLKNEQKHKSDTLTMQERLKMKELELREKEISAADRRTLAMKAQKDKESKKKK